MHEQNQAPQPDETSRWVERVERAWEDRSRLAEPEYASAVESTVAALDEGRVRVATYDATRDAWITHGWIKQAILLYFALRGLERIEVGPFEFHDKIPLKRGLDAARVRVVPPGVARYGSHLEPGVVLMPGYVNIGAWVGAGTMVDTWATVGSCAQIGSGVHLSGGVGIGGVLEPPMAQPVIVEDGAFVGSRAVIVEGVRVGREAVIGAGVVLTASTKIIDVTGPEPVERTGYVPPRAVVISGTRPRRFAAGEYGVPCALVVGWRDERTDRKVSLEKALRDFGVPA
ncbi:MAG: 2,3,4,5-tetrahydropyridine-2,6-dicarboxylate N-succinyltransferase [Myxococcota bacterium]|nr:2,3,4,5-tetrahydropyridine-2,6-dicarboxylate N-succinyltransferase [Myxococcota bacterium]MDW8360975.1 2,3,4,5-tetrahydropyridine-2,6-dicarboxylate N-succinyltransferase [Myxococcales bacterium]